MKNELRQVKYLARKQGLTLDDLYLLNDLHNRGEI